MTLSYTRDILRNPFSTLRKLPKPFRATLLSFKFWKFGTIILVLLSLGYWSFPRYPPSWLRRLPFPPPPLYSDYHFKELALPQHNPDLPFPEGRNGKYMWVANHHDGLGWGNYMQEYMLDSYLVYKTGRINVFDNYTWDRYGWDYGYRDGVVVPSRVPLSAMIAGPLVGDPFPIGNPVPPTVLVDYFQQVCPTPTIVNTGDIANELSESIRADELIQIWTENIKAIQDRCIEIDRNSGRIFSWGIFGDASRLLDVWPEYKASPIIQNFRWSDLVESAFDTNLHLFSSTDKDKTRYPYTTVNELLALHIRRGDYVSHCDELAQNAVEWNGFNAFPQFPDQWKIPTGCGDGEATPECREVYQKSCYPTIQQIVAKVEEICSTSVGQGLKNVFIMTNGETRWVEELKEALAKVRKWEKISSTLDMKLSHEQTYIDQAIDMLIGQRAQVVIGNGWSSLTSNIVMLRMARDAPPESNRFW